MKINDLKIENKIVVLATASNNKPHAIAVEVNKIVDNKIIITNNQMKNTPMNIKSNPHVSLVFWDKNDGWRIDGNAEYFNSGKWLDFVKKLPENKNYNPRGTIVIEIEEVTKLG
jgi:uncharacterized pyridoxamine 5'-phosphate oxidase family protein